MDNELRFEYYKQVRTDALSLFKDHERWDKVIEFGCGAGYTLSFLKNTSRASYVAGVERMEGLPYKEDIDSYRIGDAEEFILAPEEKYDLVLLLDVIEHLKEPEKFLRKILGHVEKGGEVLISVPNINNIRILKKLIFEDAWDYQDSGILDRTHLRFFTKTSFMKMVRVNFPELRLVHFKGNLEDLPLAQFLSKLPFIGKTFYCQYVFRYKVS